MAVLFLLRTYSSLHRKLYFTHAALKYKSTLRYFISATAGNFVHHMLRMAEPTRLPQTISLEKKHLSEQSGEIF